MSGDGFTDHFGPRAGDYAAARPGYPRALFDTLLEAAPAALAWDCATGTGQAATGLAARGVTVLATDRSARQLAAARRHRGVVYAVAAAEAAPLRDGAVDLVTVAQALHWFDRPAFHAEADRVLRPGGMLAVWCYGAPEADGDIAAVVRDLHDRVLAPYWPPERRDVVNGYRDYRLPFPEEPAPSLNLRVTFSPEGLLRYLGTWSAVAAAEAAGADPLSALRERLAGVQDTCTLIWPLTLRLARKPRGGAGGAAGTI